VSPRLKPPIFSLQSFKSFRSVVVLIDSYLLINLNFCILCNFVHFDGVHESRAYIFALCFTLKWLLRGAAECQRLVWQHAQISAAAFANFIATLLYCMSIKLLEQLFCIVRFKISFTCQEEQSKNWPSIGLNKFTCLKSQDLAFFL
jgi:hypothetical protein